MLLARYLQEGAFDRRTIEAMTTAFHAVCKSLHLTVRHDLFIDIVARKVIEIADTGERDTERLRDMALLALNDIRQRGA